MAKISSLCAAQQHQQLPLSCDVVQQHLLQQHNNQTATNLIKFEQIQTAAEPRNLPSLPVETSRSGFLFNLWQKILQQQQQQHQSNSHSSDSEGSSTDQHLKPMGAVDSEQQRQQKALELAGRDLKFDVETLALMSNERRQAAALQLIANPRRLARKNGGNGEANDDDRSGEMEENELASSGDSSHSRSPPGPPQQPASATMLSSGDNGERRQQSSNGNSATTSPNSSTESSHSGGGVVANESANDGGNSAAFHPHQVRAKQPKQVRESCKELEDKDRNNNGSGNENDVVQVLRTFPPPPLSTATAECEQCLALAGRLSLLLNRLHYLEVCNTGFQVPFSFGYVMEEVPSSLLLSFSPSLLLSFSPSLLLFYSLLFL